jgi:hypothetical protein
MLSQVLQNSVIWAKGVEDHADSSLPEVTDQWGTSLGLQRGALHVAFRREFDLESIPRSATLHLFAATRYLLFINGTYIRRGPCRFELLAAEYDSVPVREFLTKGRNVLAILVHRDNPTGRIRSVAPGLAAVFEADNLSFSTDGTWKATRDLSFPETPSVWGAIPDHRDATLMPDWVAPGFSDQDWPNAAVVPRPVETIWPRLRPRQSALTRERELATTVRVPRSLDMGSLSVELSRVELAYTAIDLEAQENTTVKLLMSLPSGFSSEATYKCRSGRQRWILDDCLPMKSLELNIAGGSASVTDFKVMEFGYPFEIAGSFNSSDPVLDQLWKLCARSAQILSEDAYVDCSDRERVEWLECSPPMAQTTRVSMVTVTPEGNVPSDPSLLRGALWRTAQTQGADGAVKAHTCSERWDKHAIMHDRGCLWVILIEEYLLHTGDLNFVRELWPHVIKQIDYWFAHQSPRGLLCLEEWGDWGNPHLYRVFEGTVLNSHFYAALRSSSHIATALGDASMHAAYSRAAKELRDSMHAHLWDHSTGTWFAGIVGQDDEIELMPPTEHAAIYALRWNVGDARQNESVHRWLWERRTHFSQRCMEAMVYYHWFEALYALDDSDADCWILEIFRSHWAEQLSGPLQTSGESLGSITNVHCYSLFPAYFLSSYVLGIRLDGDVGNQKLLIEPHLGDLQSVDGVVITEFGAVAIEWRQENDRLEFKVSLPASIQATLLLRSDTQVNLDSAGLCEGTPHGKRRAWHLSGGEHAGYCVVAKPETP